MKKKTVIMGIILFIGILLTPGIASDTSCFDAVTASDYSPMHLDEPGTLSGYVTDTEEHPIQGARIRVDFHDTYQETCSDATGYYHVTDIPLCYCMKNATCSKPGYLPASVSLAITENTMYDFILESTGPWLYVGGSGLENYTRIQDAIDNASNGDIVFVYDDSSPYIENILVDISITLLGEEKNTTIINGSTNGTGETLLEYCGIWITADNVTVSGFTVEGTNLSGISVSSNHTTISDTILSDNHYYGIVIGTSNQSGPYGICEKNTIVNNLITHNGAGMWISGQNNIIKENVITQNEVNVNVMFSMNNNISQNIISESYTGVYISGAYNTLLYRNNITQNDKGVFMMWTSADNILQNNFIGNNESASAAPGLLIQLYYKLKGEIPYPIRRSHWDENYWDKPRILPYKSPGILGFFIDWHPAQEPYNI